ncbi:MAG: hypothetical protein WAW99_01545 [Candidatus Bipolaricaulis anaerobius]|jgi:hypothetical protein
MAKEKVAPQFQEVIEMVETLPPDDQALLIDLIRQRLMQHRRNELAADIAEARNAYKRGEVRRGTAADVVRECTE